ncbi:MAG: hypothetical protein AAB092_01675 [Chloroflexota bacterium]
MSADPEPDNKIAFALAERTIGQPDSCRIDVARNPDTLELDPSMIGVYDELPIGFCCPPLGGGRQTR